MADLQKTIEIVFGGVDKVTDEVNKIGRNVESFGNDLEDIGEPFQSAVLAVAALNAAIAGIAVVGIKASSDLEAEATKMKNSLGLPIEEAQRFEEIAKDVYTAGFGEDLVSAFNAATEAQKKFGDDASVDIGKVTEAALGIQQIFEVDFSEALSAASTLMKNFGLDSDEAFDFIVSGFQRGLNTSGDFLESVTEYSTQFANGGAEAGQFFSVLETGLADGILGTDKAADAFKEFRVRIVDDSKATNEALTSLGFDPDEFVRQITTGEITAVEAFDTIIKKISETENSQVAFNAGVGLMGTQFEDLGDTAVREIDIAKTSIESLNGAFDNLDMGDFHTQFISALRTVQTEFGDLSLWDDAKDKIIAVFSDIAENLGPALEDADLSGLENKVGELWDTIANIFQDNDIDLTTTEGMENAINMIVESLESLASVTTGIVEVLAPAADAVIAIVDGFNSLNPDMQELAGNVAAVGAALGTLGGIVAVGGVLMGGLSSLTGYVKVGGSLLTGLGSAASATSGWGAAVNALAGTTGGQLGLLGVSYGIGYLIGDIANRFIPGVSDAAQAVIGWADELLNFSGTQDQATESADGFDKLVTALSNSTEKYQYDLSDLRDELTGLGYDVESLPDEAIFKIAAEADLLSVDTAHDLIQDRVEIDPPVATIWADVEQADKEITAFWDNYLALENEKTVEIDVDLDQEGIDEAKNEIIWFDENGTRHSIEIDVEKDQVTDVEKQIDDIPTEKMLEIKLQGDIDTQIAAIEAQAETAQAAFQYTAEVDIAQAQANADILIAAYDAASQSVEATADATASMFGDLASNMSELSQFDKWSLQGMVEDQIAMQEKALESQIKLNEAQAANIEAKTAAMERGDAMINITSDGLEPALEMILWQVIEKVQIRANEESADFLLGLNS